MLQPAEINTLTETLHYLWRDEQAARGVPKASIGHWSDVPDEDKIKQEQLVKRLIQALSTMNLTIVPEGTLQPSPDVWQITLPKVTALIKTFVQEKVKHPANVAAYFPSQELAHQILANFPLPDPDLNPNKEPTDGPVQQPTPATQETVTGDPTPTPTGDDLSIKNTG